MNKKYKLLKDLPDALPGDVYQWNGNGYSNQMRTAMVVSESFVEVPSFFEPVVERGLREIDGSATGLYTKEQHDYVNSIRDEDLRSHLLHQVRLRDNIEHDRDNFEKMLAKAQLKDKIIIDLEEMRNDKSEGSYYYSWQANIAMQFKDEYERLNPNMRDGNKEILHSIANNAAKKFLDMLIYQPKPEPAPQQPERIEVDEIQRHTIASQDLYCYKFYTSHNLSPHKYKFPAIKQAIEDVLNDIPVTNAHATN